MQGSLREQEHLISYPNMRHTATFPNHRLVRKLIGVDRHMEKIVGGRERDK